jgi:selenide,water dikinase
MASNRAHFGGGVEMAHGIPTELEDLLYDPQTSGGLLAAVPPERVANVLKALNAAGVPAVHIGEAVRPTSNHLMIR